MKKIITILVASFLAMALFDLAAYLLVPKEGFAALPSYKAFEARQNLQMAVRSYNRNYHIADPVMGFDIAPNQVATDFIMPDATVTIFSNELGCMDRHTLTQIQQAPSYEYITGDSFTWGYADYDFKYPSVYEALTTKMVVKCGITHSGQAHQFDKFQKVVQAIGYYPKRVIIGYFENDVINDFAYPHTTIIEGFQVDIAQVNERYQLVARDLNQIRKTILQNIDGVYPSKIEQIKAWVKAHCLSINLMDIGIDLIINLNPEQKLVTDRISQDQSRFYFLYQLSNQVRFDHSYPHLGITAPNRRAISRWAEDSRKHSYELVFLLIPTKGGYADSSAYSGLKDYLQSKKIRYIDVASAFQGSGKSAQSFYWLRDGHWNNEGNAFVGQYLAQELRQ